MFRWIVFLLAGALMVLPNPGGGRFGDERRAQGACTNCHLPPGCRGRGNEKKLGKPECAVIAISTTQDLNFGRLVVVGDGIGQVVVDPNNASKLVMGGLDDLGGWAVRGSATITGAPFEPVLINFPGIVTLVDADGSTSELRNFTTNIASGAVLDGDGRLEFAFSGTLYTDASVANGGKLRGRVNISVSYP